MYRTKTPRMKNINIPEPCSEDWNEMTPNEKGAFCQKCALDVYDFTNKSGNEIREILTLNIGSRVCGHIESKQLIELNSDFSAWRLDNKQSFQRAWIFTLFVVFGMTLFSCETDEAPVVDHFQKIGQEILTKTELSDTIDLDVVTDGVCVPEDAELPSADAKGVTTQNHQSTLRGWVDYEEEKPRIIEETSIIDYPNEDQYYIFDGMMLMSPDYEVFLGETNDDIVSVVNSNEIKKIVGLVYPNPASNQTTLKVNMPSRGKAEIELIGLNGQKVRTIHSGRIPKGESEYPIDLSDLETGSYLIVIYRNGNKETVKFSKM